MNRPEPLLHPSPLKGSVDLNLSDADRRRLHDVVLTAIDGIEPDRKTDVLFGPNGSIRVELYDEVAMEDGEELEGMTMFPLSDDAMLARATAIAAVVTVWENTVEGPDSAVTLFGDLEAAKTSYTAIVEHYENL